MVELSARHNGRELLHGIDLMLQCLRLSNATASERRGWWREIRRSRAGLEVLYAAGLRRDFRRTPEATAP
jgi:hypothetical protein